METMIFIQPFSGYSSKPFGARLRSFDQGKKVQRDGILGTELGTSSVRTDPFAYVC